MNVWGGYEQATLRCQQTRGDVEQASRGLQVLYNLYRGYQSEPCSQTDLIYVEIRSNASLRWVRVYATQVGEAQAAKAIKPCASSAS